MRGGQGTVRGEGVQGGREEFNPKLYIENRLSSLGYNGPVGGLASLAV